GWRWGALICLGAGGRVLAELITIEVPMWPGITTDTLMCGAFSLKSLISASLKPFTANFAALYAVCADCGPSDAQKPLTELVLHRCASVLRMSNGRNAREQ